MFIAAPFRSVKPIDLFALLGEPEAGSAARASPVDKMPAVGRVQDIASAAPADAELRHLRLLGTNGD
jgi:hypothetical protein